MFMEKNKRITKRLTKITMLFLLTVVFVGTTALSTMAASKKAIKSCSITVDGVPVVGELLGEDSLDVSASGTGFVLDHFEETNELFAWEGGETPEITVYLTAKSGYYFAITKASQIKLKGCTFVSAKRQDSATTLVVCVKLNKSVGYKIGEVEEATLSSNMTCTWEPVEEAGSYEVRFLLGNATLGGTQTTTQTTLNCADKITKSGTYRFKVRAVHKNDPEVKGEWKASNDINISDAEAKVYSDAAEAKMSAGTWVPDKKGTKFQLPDGTFVTNAWRKIHKKWYYFKADGYRATGWTQLDGAYYYFDPTTGEMAVNTTVDGYEIAIDGRRIEK